MERTAEAPFPYINTFTHRKQQQWNIWEVERELNILGGSIVMLGSSENAKQETV